MKLLENARIPKQPYPELREVLILFVEDVAACLGENLVGIYLIGSIATGDFDADSDIDFLVVTRAEPTESEMKALQEIQVKIFARDCYPARHLEGSYISIHDLNDWSGIGIKELYYFDNGSTIYEKNTHDNRWHVRWVLRERGITLVGPEPNTFVEPVLLHEMLNEIRASMRQEAQVFQEKINQPLSFWNSRFGQSFFVLLFCRMLHTLHTGTIQSKKAGAQWARQMVKPEWIPLIDHAWEERGGVRFGVKIGQPADPHRLAQTLDFINYAVSQMDTIELQAE